MSEMTMSSQERASQRPVLAVVWFVFMVGMWLVFFTLLITDQLASLWNNITQLPLFVEIAIWIGFLPWMLGSWVWLGSWPLWLRLGLVLCFAIGWSIVSIPRKRVPRAGV